MPSASKPRRTLEDLEAAAAAHRPVQDRVADYVAVDQVQASPRNPRHKVEGLDELAASLDTYGLLQPVVVRRVNGAYELIAGHRRLAAAKQLGWAQIAAVVRNEADDQAYLLTLTENLQREDLTPKEEAAALEVLVRERGWSTRQVGEAIKRSAMYVSKRLRVFEDPVLASPVLSNTISVSTAEEFLRVPEEEREQFIQQAIDERWGWAQARQAVAERKGPLQSDQPAPRLASRVRALARELSGIDPTTLPPRTRREIAHLASVAQRVAS